MAEHVAAPTVGATGTAPAPDPESGALIGAGTLQPVRVTVLGASPVCPNPGGACSGYLLEAGKTRIVVDLGSGALSRLLEFSPLGEFDAVVISHAHPDHWLDLISLRYGLLLGPRRSAVAAYVGPTHAETMRRTVEGLGNEPAFFDGLVDMREYGDVAPLRIGDVDVSFAPTVHYGPTWAMRFEHDGQSVVYSADTGPSDDVVRLAGTASLFICESTILRRSGFEREWGHASAAEAGRMAQQAKAHRLMLTHYWAQNNPDDLIAEAAREYGGPIELAVERRCYDLVTA
jgi:ribonuclease BN (tRNA processing enzyme)